MAKSSKNRKKTQGDEQQSFAMFDRLPPHNIEAERAVIGAVLLNPREVCDDVALILRPNDFYLDQHRIIYEHLDKMYSSGQGVDLLLLVENLKSTDNLEAAGGEAYLAELSYSVHVIAHAKHYATIVRDKAILRALINASAKILHDAYEPEHTPRELVSKAEESIFAINDERGGSQASKMHDVLVETFRILDARLDGATAGIPTGFADIDGMTGGLHGSELLIVAGRPSMGKTAFATNIADHVAVEQKKPTIIFSLEMARVELAQRMLCCHGRVDAHRLRAGYLSTAENQALAKASGELSASPLYIDDSPSRTVTEIGAVARRLKRQEDLGLIVIDYLGLIEPDNPSDPRQEQVAKIARRLKGLARELNVPVLCLAQLNRAAEATKDNRPRLSHLRESGAIEQDADVVMFVHREEYYHKRETAEEMGIVGQAEIMIAKQRNGPVGDVKLAWFGEYTLFASLAEADPGEYTEFTSFQDPTGFSDSGEF